VQAWSVIGREFSIATNQVDFAQPRSFDLRYKDRDNIDKYRFAFIARHSARTNVSSDFYRALRRQFPALVISRTGPHFANRRRPKCSITRVDLNELRRTKSAPRSTDSDNINGKIQRAEANESPHHVRLRKRDMDADAVSVRVHGKKAITARKNRAHDERSPQ
jgi:threonyl-tRNA synthetase